METPRFRGTSKLVLTVILIIWTSFFQSVLGHRQHQQHVFQPEGHDRAGEEEESAPKSPNRRADSIIGQFRSYSGPQSQEDFYAQSGWNVPTARDRARRYIEDLGNVNK